VKRLAVIASLTRIASSGRRESTAWTAAAGPSVAPTPEPRHDEVSSLASPMSGPWGSTCHRDL